MAAMLMVVEMEKKDARKEQFSQTLIFCRLFVSAEGGKKARVILA
jgi:hypothetical protein